jgi:hypothetical protein
MDVPDVPNGLAWLYRWGMILATAAFVIIPPGHRRSVDRYLVERFENIGANLSPDKCFGVWVSNVGAAALGFE